MLYRRKRKPADAIMPIGPADWLTLHEAFSNVFCSAQVGAGKTTGPMAHLAIGLLQHPSRPGALWLCQKPDEAARAMRYCEMTNRAADIIHVKLGGEHCIDLLDYTLSGPGGVEDAKALISVIMEVANRNRTRNSSDSYWPESAERAMGYGATLVKMATGTCSFGNLLEFMQSLPNSPDHLSNRDWLKGSFAAACVNGAAAAHREMRAFEMAATWFASEWPQLSDKTRSVIHSVTLNTLDKFLSGQFASLISADTTTFTPEMTLNDGKIVILDVPGAVYGPAAQWASVAVKLLFQKAAMRRDLSKACRPLILWADEAANFCVPELDAMFLSQSRQFKTICVNIVQNMPLVITALGSNEAARHQAYAWHSNHATVMIGAQTDPESCELYSKMGGEIRETFWGGSSGGNTHFDLMAHVMGQPVGNVNVSWHQQIRPAIPPYMFGNLKKGGKQFAFVSEAYVMQSGRIFSNGKHWIKAQWKQIL